MKRLLWFGGAFVLLGIAFVVVPQVALRNESVVITGIESEPPFMTFTAEQENSEGSVTVLVRPQTVLPSASVWIFAVSLGTHSVDLIEDVARASVLIDAEGNEYPALAWEGDPSGGHHRSGTLQFAALPVWPTLLTLELRDIGGVAVRRFAWRTT